METARPSTCDRMGVQWNGTQNTRNLIRDGGTTICSVGTNKRVVTAARSCSRRCFHGAKAHEKPTILCFGARL